jgi:hypothetical protein
MEDLFGVLLLIVYIVGILALSAGVTFLVIKISPSQSAKEQAAEKNAS